eukprot:s671_g18.t1
MSQRIFSKLTDEEQLLVRLNVVGGFQTEKRKANWDDDNDGTCPLCGQDDTRQHRLLECAFFQKLRDEWPGACQTLKESRPEWVYLPLPRLHEHVSTLRDFFEKVTNPDIPEPQQVNSQKLRFFTDGGSTHPTRAFSRIATWTVIQDLSVTEQQQKDAADFFFLDDPMFPLFHVSAVGIVKGRQTAARGELTAMLVAVQSACKATEYLEVEFVTDAAYVCAVIHLIRERIFQDILHKLPNSDLILGIAQYWDAERFIITKVKSHRASETATDLQDLWKIAGKFCADKAISTVLKTVPTQIRRISDGIAAFQAAEEQRLETVFQYLTQLNTARTVEINRMNREAKDQNRNLDMPKLPPERRHGLFDSEAMGLDAIELMKEFDPPGYISLSCGPIDDEVFSLCLQGENIGKALILWSQTLRWPPNYDTPDKNDWGMSWLELIFNFYVTTGSATQTYNC